MKGGFKRYLLPFIGVLIVLYIFCCFNEAENAKQKIALRELLLAKETEKRIKYEYNRIIEELKKNELTLEKAIKQQHEKEIKTDEDFKMRIQSDEEYVKGLQDLIKNHIDLKNKALDKISITEKKLKKKLTQLEGKNITIRK
jgi:hypothetical protein